MKRSFLLPRQFSLIGWILLIPGLLLGLYYFFVNDEPGFFYFLLPSIANDEFMGGRYFFTLVENNFFDELIGVLIILGAIGVAFSRRKEEDEFIARIRLDALMWATYINYLVLVLAILFVYGMSFFWVLVFNMFTTLIFFLARFRWLIFKSERQLHDEK